MESDRGATATANRTARLVERWPAMSWFVVIGSMSIIGGGLVAAATRPTDFEAGSWVAAYLVLVGGVAQIALGVGQAVLPAAPPPERTVVIEAVSWFIGSAAVVAGTLLGTPWITTLGAVVMAAALSTFIVTVRRTDVRDRTIARAYRMTVSIVLLSIPIGVMLAWFRHG